MSYYYDRDGLSPLWDVGTAGDVGSTASHYLLLCLYVFGIMWSFLRLYRNGAMTLTGATLLLPAFITSILHFSPILLSLPLLLGGALTLQKSPSTSAIIVSFGTVLLIHPLLGYFFIFTRTSKTKFGLTALITTLLLLLIPLVRYSPTELWDLYAAWVMGFRSTPTGSDLPMEYSPLHLMRELTTLSPYIQKLILINLFHIQLLPCLKMKRLSEPGILLPLFTSSLLMFIGLFSAMNTPYTSLIAVVGMLGWWHYGSFTKSRRNMIGITTLLLVYGALLLRLFGSSTPMISPYAIEAMGTLPLFVVWSLCIIEIWKRIYAAKKGTI